MRSLAVVCCLCVPLVAETKLPPAADITVVFDQHVKPILSQNCYSCHGAKVQQSGLRLDKRQNALRGGDYGPVIVSGKSAESKLILRLVSGDGGMQMPPAGALTAEDIGILRAWIDQGADFGKVEIKEEVPVTPVDPKLKALISAVRSMDLRNVQKLVKADPGVIQMQDQGGSTPLHHAAGFGDAATMKLLLDEGAAVNSKNRRGSTPLHWAIGDEAKVRLLLGRGAEINAKQVEGRTPLYQAASSGNSNLIVRILLEKGADPNLTTVLGTTPLMAASGRGDVEAMRLLIEKKADVHAKSGTGASPLTAAAMSRNAEAVRMLLDHGADANTMTKRKVTPLANAAMQGATESAKLLIERGAKVNLQDDPGYSPLMYAAYSEDMSVSMVKLLLNNGADQTFSGEGETARSLAAKRGDNEVARLLGVSEEERKQGGVPKDQPVSSDDRSIPVAVQKALTILEQQSHNFIRIGGCNSCHNQNLPSAAAALARERGIPAPKAIAKVSLEMSERSFERTMDMSVIGVNSVGYEVFDLGMNRVPKSEYTDSVARYMKSMQTPEGIWKTTGNRPPLTSDDFQTTAFSIYALKQFAPAAEKADTDKRLARAAAWLERAKPVTTQERAFHLLGLAWANAAGDVIERAAKGLAETQRTDGGWSQLPTMGSDAYATGEALYALQSAGKFPAKDVVSQKGIRYLLRTQAADGSWHVKTRSLPFQPYFESGFPYGHDQWISAAGTAWASMALSLSVEPQRISRNTR